MISKTEGVMTRERKKFTKYNLRDFIIPNIIEPRTSHI